MSIHPLRYAYIKTLRRLYGATVRGDKNPDLTERAAMKIVKLGLDYNAYMDIAVKLCAGFAKEQGWKYPYYNVVIGDKTIDKVKRLTRYAELDMGDDDQSDVFEYELSYAVAYIDWWFGRGDKPIRGDTVTQTSIKTKVAEYLCRMYGIPHVTSNYNKICMALETLNNEQ